MINGPYSGVYGRRRVSEGLLVPIETVRSRS